MANDLSAEVIREIERLATGNRRMQFVKRPGDPEHVVHLVDHQEGKAERQTVEPPTKSRQLETPQSFAEFVRTHSKGAGLVFYTRESLTWEESNRLDRAMCELLFSPQYKLLSETKPVDQPAFVRRLRIDLRGCVPDESNLLKAVRELKFGASVDSAGSIQHQRESIGKSVLAQVSGASAIPEEIILQIPIFENFAFRTFLPCAIEIFPTDQRFKLTPYPLALSEAADRAMAEIAKLLGVGDEPISPDMPFAHYGLP